MDFKIGDEIEDVENEETEPSKLKIKSRLPLIIVIASAIIVGVGVFVISSSLFGPKKPDKPETRQALSLKDSNVDILYIYVTYGTRNTRNDKFIKESKVTIDSFTDEEKFYYALQFADADDFEFTGTYDEENHKIYTIPDTKVRKYMTRFFGNKVTYNKKETITYPFSFRINGQNVGIMKYSVENRGYDTIFNGYEPDIEEEDGIKPYYTELTGAYKELDGTYTLEEKVIYTELEPKDEDTYTLSIYKDYDHKSLIERKTNLSKEDIEKTKIDISDYKKKASTITYRFGLDGNTLYFESSTIKK